MKDISKRDQLAYAYLSVPIFISGSEKRDLEGWIHLWNRQFPVHEDFGLFGGILQGEVTLALRKNRQRPVVVLFWFDLRGTIIEEQR